MNIKHGDTIHIPNTEISYNGIGIVKDVCKHSVTVIFKDTGKLGIYNKENLK